MEYYYEEIERENEIAMTKSGSQIGQPGHHLRRKITPRTRTSPSKPVLQSIEVDLLTTQNESNESPCIGRKRKTKSQPPRPKRHKRNLDKSYKPKIDQDDEDRNNVIRSERTKQHSTTSPTPSRKRRGSIYKDSGEKSSDDEDDGKQKSKKRLRCSSPTPSPKRQKRDNDDDDEAGTSTDPPAKNTRAAWKIRRALLSTTSSKRNSEKSKPQTTTTPKSKSKSKMTIRGISPFFVF